GCDTLLVTFTNTSGTGVYYNWEFDDGESYFGTDTTHLFDRPGEYRVQMHAFDGSFGYVGSFEQTIIVEGLDGIGGSTDSICPGDYLYFWYNGAGNSFSWDFGDGQTSNQENPNHMFSDTGTYMVTLVLGYTCGSDTDTTYIRVDSLATPNAQFWVNGDSICPGDKMRFRANYYSETAQYLWDFGDGSTSNQREPMHGFPGVGDFAVSLSITNPCGNTGMYTDTVKVRQGIGFGFVGGQVMAGCPGDQTMIRFFSDGDLSFPMYIWNTGDGMIDTTDSPEFMHVYADTGNYNVMVTAINGCGADTTLYLNADIRNDIFPDLNSCGGPCFGLPDEGSVYCPGDDVVLYFAGEYASNIWHFGDGDSGVATQVINVGGGDGGPQQVTIIRHAFPDTGSYWARLTVTNACGNSSTDSVEVVITGGNGLDAQIFIPNPPHGSNYYACEEVSFLVVGGSSFDWDFGDGNTILGGSPDEKHIYDTPGNYNVTVIAMNGCGEIDTTTTALTIGSIMTSLTDTTPTCYGGNDGVLHLDVMGVAPFMFMWNNGATTKDLVGIPTGTYSVTVTDANGCSVMDSKFVNQPDQMDPNETITPSTCGNADGSIALNPNDVVPPVTYMWDDVNSQTSATATGLSAGNYSVTLTDSRGCMINETFSVGDVTAPSVSVSKTNPDCPGGNDGMAIVVASGGVPPYSYVWDDPQATITDTLKNVPAGNYCVVVIDQNLCLATACVTITNPTPILITATAINSTCNGANNGSLDADASGGTSPYTYIWDNGITTDTATALPPGPHTVTVTDANGCTAMKTFNTGEPAKLKATMNPHDVSCNGGSNGTVDLNPMGGVKPYTYSWSNSATTQDIGGLSPMKYYVTLTDANGCMVVDSAEVKDPPVLGTTGTPMDASCKGGNDGSVDLSVTGGTPPYHYSWNNSSTMQDAVGLSAGNYMVTVTDANGCTATDGFVVGEPNQLNAPMGVTDASCNGGNDGMASVSPTGGMPGYTYMWSSGQTSASISGLMAGNYDVTVTDSKGCTAVGNVTVGQPSAVTVSTDFLNTQDATCGNSDGMAGIDVFGGNPGYTFAWSNGATTEDLTNIPAGSYTVTVTDANGCTKTFSTNISNLSAPTVTENLSDPTCHGNNDGSVNISTSGGTTPYSYLWNTGATTEDLMGVTAGTYNITVTDSTGCLTIKSYTLNEPDAVDITFAVTSPTCHGDSDGEIDVTVNGGTPGYVYLWDNGATTEDLSNLSNGVHMLTVTDLNGCIDTASINVTEPAQLMVNASTTNVNCNSGQDGAIDLTVSGGTVPYTFMWSNGATTEDVGGLMAGTYNVTVTDAHGCADSLAYPVTEPSILALVTTPVDVSCAGGSDGSLSVSAAGGVAPYTYLWENGDTTTNRTGLKAGSYSVSVTDANNCAGVFPFAITEPAAILATGSITNSTCGNADGAVDLTVSGGVPPYTYLWSNGATTEDITGVSSSSYAVTVTDANSCTNVTSHSVSDAGGPSVASANAYPSCNGDSDGAIDATPSGGATPYTFLWSTGATTEDLTGLTSGSYSLTVTDNNGCKGVLNVNLMDPPALYLSISATTGQSSVDLYADVFGGTPGYNYVWAPGGATTQSINVTVPDKYFVTVTDANGCTEMDSLEVISVFAPQNADPVSTLNIYPNPYRGYTNITYELTQRTELDVIVMDMMGRKIASLASGMQDVGRYSHTFSAEAYDLLPGTYMVVLRFGNNVTTRRIIQMQ
ncbi:MAG: PKD domain-containing protein, partial [Flavobacteriales bacterium]|nr:PKD domain-containing protein [Flavobacteriales bacterium]